jgi:hypothetical protein
MARFDHSPSIAVHLQRRRGAQDQVLLAQIPHGDGFNVSIFRMRSAISASINQLV